MRKILIISFITVMILVSCDTNKKYSSKNEIKDLKSNQEFTKKSGNNYNDYLDLEEEKQEVVQIDKNHWKTYTHIVINAPKEEVWKTLRDWDNMPNWSSSLQGISGDIVDGGSVTALYSLNGNTNEIPHTLKYSEGNYYGWSDPMGARFLGLTDNHLFEVKSLSDKKTLFIQTDEYKGEGNEQNSAEDVARQTVKNFPIFNRELKEEVIKRLNKD